MNFDQSKIEDYIFGRLSEEEMDHFQFALMRDANLRKEVEAMRALKYIARAKKGKKKNKLVFFSPKRLWRVAAVFIGLTTLAVLIALYNNRQKEMPIVDDKKNTPVEQKENINEQHLVEEKEKETPQIDLPEIKEEEKKEEEIANDPPPKKEKRKKPLELKKSPEKDIEEYVETPPDTNQELEPIIYEPLEYSNIESGVDTSGQVTVHDTFRFEVNSLAIAAPELWLDINEIGDTTYKMMVPIWYFDTTYMIDSEKMDSFLAVKEAEEMMAFPTKVKLSLSFKKPENHSLYSIPENPNNPESWAVNPTLEEYIKQGNQNDSLEISFKIDSSPFVRDGDGLLTIDYYCDAYGKFPELIDLKIFTNKEKDFQDNRPLIEIECTVDNTAGDFITGNFPLGLYYVVFEKLDGEIIAVQKFHVIE